MGKQWDYDVSPVEIWEQVFRVLKPGGHLLSFGGSRTYHRLVCRIEDAGFEIGDQIMWIHGQGFPKSHNISKQLDKANFANELAEEWDGWGTALKPAHEPICLARKPIVEKTVAKNVVEWGTGAINIDESRISLEANDKLQNAIEGRAGESIDTGITDTKWGFKAVDREAGLGRWPANIIHDSSEEVLRCFPNTKSGALTAEQQKGGGFAGTKNCYGTAKTGGSNEYNSNKGSAARFYYCAKASKSDRDEGLEKFLEKFQAGAEFRPNHMEKALQGETGNPYGRWDPRRNNHPTVKPTNLMKYLIKLVTQKGGIVLDPFMGSGTTGKACGFEDYKFVGIEMDKNYFEIAKARVEHAYRKETVGLEKFFK